MTVINTNTAATLTANALTKNERAMNQTMERLSTGQRINSAADDAAGLAISSKMTSQINGLNMAVKNANDAISMIQTEDGAMIEVTNMLQRMRELAVQAASDTNTSTDRASLDVEFTALASEMQRIGANTQWNGKDLVDGVGTAGAQAFQIGANASQTISHTFAQLETTAISRRRNNYLL
jgi:flagellin